MGLQEGQTIEADIEADIAPWATERTGAAGS